MNLNEPTELWAVMKAYKWIDMVKEGQPIRFPDIFPQRFIPVFNTKEQAIEFNKGSSKNIIKMSVPATK